MQRSLVQHKKCTVTVTSNMEPERQGSSPAWAKTCHSFARAKIAIGSRCRAPECGLRYIGAAEARNIEPVPNVDDDDASAAHNARRRVPRSGGGDMNMMM